MWYAIITGLIVIGGRELFKSWEKDYGKGGAWAIILTALGLIVFTACVICLH
jgi:hypothetical protein